jgi:glycosyltransferase 2 family protein
MWIAGYVHRPDQFEFFPLARFWGDELRRPIVVVSDQSGIGRGYFDETAYADLTRRMCARFEAGTDRPRVPFPYHPLHATGEYRRDHPRSKPNPGMIFQAVSDRAFAGPGVLEASPIQCLNLPLRLAITIVESARLRGLRHRRRGRQGRIGSRSRMSTSVANELDTTSASRGRGVKKLGIFAAKLLVTGACFWYLSRQINLGQVISALPLLDFRWAAFAVLVVMLEIPLGGLRWSAIVDALAARDERVTRTVMIGVTAIGVFFAQVLPSVAGDGIRAWLLARRGYDWRNAVISVVIDRAIGAGLLLALGFVILLLPSGLTALGGYRDVVLVVYAGLLLAGALGLLLAPRIAPLLARWRYSRWLAKLAVDARRVLLGPRGPLILALGCLIHALTIVVVWSVGRAEGLVLPISDAAVLFTVMIGVALVPISISGWGLRELAVISLLGNHGIAPERALLFSVCFGLVLAAGSLPGAVVWLFYSFVPSWRSAERGG